MPTANPEPNILTVSEAANALRIGRTAMYELLSKGEIPSFTVGRSRRLRRSDLDDYIKRRVALARY